MPVIELGARLLSFEAYEVRPDLCSMHVQIIITVI